MRLFAEMMAQETEIVAFERAFYTLNVAQKWIGIEQYFKKTDQNNIVMYLKKIYFISLFANLAFSIVGGIWNLIDIVVAKKKEQYFDAAELMPCLLLMLLVFVKVFRVVAYSDDVIELMSNFEDIWPKSNTIANVRRVWNNNMIKAIKLINVYAGVIVSSIVLLNLTPFIANFIKDESPDRIIPFQLKYIFDYETSNVRYAIVLVSQVCASSTAGLSMCVMDCFIIIIMVLASSHFEVLSEMLRAMPEYQDLPTTEQLLDMNNKMNTVVRKHINLLRVCGLTQKLMNPIFFSIFIFSSIIICMMLFIISIAPLDKQMNFICLLCSLILQFFLICYYSNKIVEQSVFICDAMYGCQWYNSDKTLRSKVLLVQIRAQKPVVMTAYSYVDISLVTFCQIVKGSWSYFTLLKVAGSSIEY